MRLLPLLVGLSLVAGCFVNRAQPPAFRFQCKTDGDCEEPELCIGELCQVPCTTETWELDCPPDKGYQGCFNGVCAHTCMADEEHACPAPQTCQVADPPLPGLENFGVCGVLCDEADPAACPEGELCLLGVCLPAAGETGTDGGASTGTDDAGSSDSGGSGA